MAGGRCAGVLAWGRSVLYSVRKRSKRRCWAVSEGAAVGAMVWAIGSGLGGTTGFAINPARDLGPRIAHALLPIPGKGGSDFSYGLTVPVLGGLVGGGLAGLFIRIAHL